ncbi:hypothetical protein F6V30_08735 [Oryzomonas sagensis]|uniref:Cohesin domain-containing protein n=1 Tax=Oryzomonas sagensis TaxID=2603857 RepID=A0ABQ6TPL0_9BACT|nr:cohesin domain-containing protein [Oryzomonas sagensis]KAB0670235.1 hypothetical protein F6V30_08735 [Oryzomonas sagensis]
MGKIVTRIRSVLMAVGAACLLAACGSGDSAPTSGNQTASHLSIVPSGNGIYVIRGDNLSDTAGIELTLSYDKANMSSPTVTQGTFISGAMLVANTLTPGTIRIAMISNRAFSGSGPIATVSFATVTGAGTIGISSYSIINSNGTGAGPSPDTGTGPSLPSSNGTGTGNASTGSASGSSTSAPPH